MGRVRGETKDFSEKIVIIESREFSKLSYNKYLYLKPFLWIYLAHVLSSLSLYFFTPPASPIIGHFPPNSTLSLHLYIQAYLYIFIFNPIFIYLYSTLSFYIHIQPYLSHGLNCVLFAPSCVHCSRSSTIFLKI